MTDHTFEERLLLYFDGALSGKEKRALRRELRVNPSKQRLLDQYSQLNMDLSTYSSYLGIPTSTEHALLHKLPQLATVKPVIPSVPINTPPVPVTWSLPLNGIKMCLIVIAPIFVLVLGLIHMYAPYEEATVSCSIAHKKTPILYSAHSKSAPQPITVFLDKLVSSSTPDGRSAGIHASRPERSAAFGVRRFRAAGIASLTQSNASTNLNAQGAGATMLGWDTIPWPDNTEDVGMVPSLSPFILRRSNPIVSLLSDTAVQNTLRVFWYTASDANISIRIEGGISNVWQPVAESPRQIEAEMAVTLYWEILRHVALSARYEYSHYARNFTGYEAAGRTSGGVYLYREKRQIIDEQVSAASLGVQYRINPDDILFYELSACGGTTIGSTMAPVASIGIGAGYRMSTWTSVIIGLSYSVAWLSQFSSPLPTVPDQPLGVVEAASRGQQRAEHLDIRIGFGVYLP